MSTMTPEERAKRALKDLSGCSNPGPQCEECVGGVTAAISDAEAEARINERDRLASRCADLLENDCEWDNGAAIAFAEELCKPPAESEVRGAMERAIKRAEEKSSRLESGRTPQSSTKADAAVQKLRQDRRLTREELDRPCICESDDGHKHGKECPCVRCVFGSGGEGQSREDE